MTTIGPGATRARWDLGLKEVFAYRELLMQLLRRDMMGMLHQSALGFLWRIIAPVFMIGGYTFIFAVLGKLPKVEGNPYFLTLYAAVLPYNLLIGTLFDTVNSISANSAIIKKIYFPRLIFPIVAVINKVVDFLIGIIVLVLMLLAMGRAPSALMVAVLPFALWALIAGLAAGLWLAYLNVLYRDISIGLPIVTQILFYLSPVVYPSQFVPEPFRTLMQINPLVGIIDGSRWAMLGTTWVLGPASLVSLMLTLLLLVGGFIFFRRTERVLADVL
ncbi:MAG TPA: ABC transporter permease [Stellaceae bacterium]|jgi:lipopolysaccharide transport system permease protein